MQSQMKCMEAGHVTTCVVCMAQYLGRKRKVTECFASLEVRGGGRGGGGAFALTPTLHCSVSE